MLMLEFRIGKEMADNLPKQHHYKYTSTENGTQQYIKEIAVLRVIKVSVSKREQPDCIENVGPQGRGPTTSSPICCTVRL